MELPEWGDAEEKAKQTGRNLIPWLPDPHTCDCGALCYAEVGYVERQADYMDIWQCRECGKRYYRDEG